MYCYVFMCLKYKFGIHLPVKILMLLVFLLSFEIYSEIPKVLNKLLHVAVRIVSEERSFVCNNLKDGPQYDNFFSLFHLVKLDGGSDCTGEETTWVSDPVSRKVTLLLS